MFTRRISKSQFMMGLQCVKRLWLYNYRRELLPAIEPGRQRIFDEGHEIGELARQYFKGGKLINADYKHIPEALEQTAESIKSGVKIIYEGAFVFNNVLVRCDILKRNADKSWDLLEVKGTTQVKEEHLRDVSLQRFVLESSGLRLKNIWLMHINNSFVKNGPVQAKKIFKRIKITDETSALQNEMAQKLKIFSELLDGKTEPAITIGQHCYAPHECDFCGYCWQKVPDYSIYDIPRLNWEKKNQLAGMGILDIRNVPESFDLNEGQKLYIKAEKTGQVIIDKNKIRGFLTSLIYPLYHIDFETIMPGIPIYDKTKPYQQLPFQISMHIQNAPLGEPRHLEYLGDPETDPRPELIKFMLDNIGPEGSLLAYNANFEKSRLNEMAENFPEHRAALTALAQRLKDLMLPFQKQAFVHPDFHGRFSIKKVLPALVPEMSYDSLEIGNGADAQLAYMAMINGKLPKNEIEKIRKNLKIYCGQDTLAMVKILNYLYLSVCRE